MTAVGQLKTHVALKTSKNVWQRPKILPKCRDFLPLSQQKNPVRMKPCRSQHSCPMNSKPKVLQYNYYVTLYECVFTIGHFDGPFTLYSSFVTACLYEKWKKSKIGSTSLYKSFAVVRRFSKYLRESCILVVVPK